MSFFYVIAACMSHYEFIFFIICQLTTDRSVLLIIFIILDCHLEVNTHNLNSVGQLNTEGSH